MAKTPLIVSRPRKPLKEMSDADIDAWAGEIVDGMAERAAARRTPLSKWEGALVDLRKLDTGSYHVLDIVGLFRERARLLTLQLQRDVERVLAQLGEEAAAAYLNMAEKREGDPSFGNRLLHSLRLRQWLNTHLMAVLRNGANRVVQDTQQVLTREVGVETQVGNGVARRIYQAAGKDLNVRDIEPAIREAIMRVVQEGLDRGESPIETARRMRQWVPAGRFTKAGPKYRAQLIARNETAIAQREAILDAYKHNPHVIAVELRDGIYGPPRSDQRCMARDHQIVPIADAAEVLPYHPLCTLSANPVMGTSA